MKRKMISGKDLIKLGYPEGKVIALAINAIHKYYRRSEKEEISTALLSVLSEPNNFLDNSVWSGVATALLPEEKKLRHHELRKNRIEYAIFGAEEIEEGARNQMEIAMKLPVTAGCALMADAHQGYGLPIGGVLATVNAVIPYGVGVDIGCRMCLSVYPINEAFIDRNKSRLKKMLIDNTSFGSNTMVRPKDHEVLNRKLFSEIAVLRNLKGRAAMQIGSSGSGNHFVEFGLAELYTGNEWNIAAGKYVSVLSHSGSRGLGAEVARHYTRLAKELCRLPTDAANLAWLDLDSEAGQEYWMAMNLAGDYSAANHQHIHQRMSASLGEKPLLVIENHHNFAWKESLLDGTEVIVHRKGATPAGKDVYGIIPGSVTAPGFIVKGKGHPGSLNSASHGAGRRMSRSAAKDSITAKMLRQELQRFDVEMIGGGVDEAPMAYKDIRKVMHFQDELVEVLGEFSPRIVRMAGDDSLAED